MYGTFIHKLGFAFITLNAFACMPVYVNLNYAYVSTANICMLGRCMINIQYTSNNVILSPTLLTLALMWYVSISRKRVRCVELFWDSLFVFLESEQVWDLNSHLFGICHCDPAFCRLCDRIERFFHSVKRPHAMGITLSISESSSRGACDRKSAKTSEIPSCNLF